MRQVLLGDEVFRHGPAFHVAAQNKFGFHFALLLSASNGVGLGQIGLTVVPDNFQQRLVGAVDILKFDVEDGVDPVFTR